MENGIHGLILINFMNLMISTMKLENYLMEFNMRGKHRNGRCMDRNRRDLIRKIKNFMPGLLLKKFRRKLRLKMNDGRGVFESK